MPFDEALQARFFGLASHPDGGATYLCAECATKRYDHADRRILSRVKPPMDKVEPPMASPIDSAVLALLSGKGVKA